MKSLRSLRQCIFSVALTVISVKGTSEVVLYYERSKRSVDRVSVDIQQQVSVCIIGDDIISVSRFAYAVLSDRPDSHVWGSC